MVMDGNQTFGDDHLEVYTGVELYCCTPETYAYVKKVSCLEIHLDNLG